MTILFSCEGTIMLIHALAQEEEKVKNATKHWVCSKVKYWFIKNGPLTTMILKKKLKEHYKVSVHYKRVWMGKELALR